MEEGQAGQSGAAKRHFSRMLKHEDAISAALFKAALL